jgi:hypothetical protein
MEYTITTPREREITVFTGSMDVAKVFLRIHKTPERKEVYTQALLDIHEVDELITALLYARKQATGVAYELP